MLVTGLGRPLVRGLTALVRYQSKVYNIGFIVAPAILVSISVFLPKSSRSLAISRTSDFYTDARSCERRYYAYSVRRLGLSWIEAFTKAGFS